MNGRKFLGFVVMGLMVSAAIGGTRPGRQFLHSAQAAVRYYHALENAEVPTGFWSRLTYSLLLAGAESGGASRATARGATSS